MTISCILIDDEAKALTSLAYELAKFEHRIQVLATFTKAKEAITYLKTQEVDVIFLDVEMPNMNGFAFLEAVKDFHNYQIIFTTAYNQYALEAIRKEALDFLVKPIDPEDLKKALERIEKTIQQLQIPHQLELALERIKELDEVGKRIKLSVDKKIVFLEPEEILYCESDGNYCRIVLENNKELYLTQKLKQIEELLPKHRFYRVHNSFLINLFKVKEFHKNEGYLVLDKEIKIPVSRQKRSEFLDRIS